MDWATERNLPINEYFELEDHPANKTQKTMIELMQKNIIKDKFSERKLYAEGIVSQENIAKSKESWGLIL